MYGAKTTLAGSTTGLAGMGSATGNVWMLFAAITIMFACSAVMQLARKPKDHRP